MNENKSGEGLKAVGQLLVVLSGAILVGVAYLATNNLNVLFGLVAVGGMLVNMPSDPIGSIKSGVVALVINLLIGIVLVSTHNPDVTFGLLLTWFVMIRV